MTYTNGSGWLGALHGQGAQDEDALPYSRTEQEASIHEPLGTSGITHSSTLSLSLNSEPHDVVCLQDRVLEVRRLLDRERSTRTSMENKCENLETEKSGLILKLEKVTRAKSQLEQNKIDVDSKLRTLRYQTIKETEKQRTAEVLLSKTKEQLARKEDQYTGEVEAKQKAELSMSNLQMELRTMLSNIKQLEEDKENFVRQLQHEKNSRQQQEQINKEQQRLAKQLKLSEEASQLADIKLQEEALAHATMQYNITLSQLRTDNTVLTSSVERERSAREELAVEVDSLCSRLSSTSSELEKSQAARSELDRNNHKEHEEWSRQLDRRDVELNSLKENNQNLSLRVGAAEAKMSAMASKLHIATAMLIERNNQLSTFQRDLDIRRGNQESMDKSLRKDREDSVRMSAKMESLSERLTNVQHENLNLKQQIDDARLRDMSRKGDTGDKMNNMLASLRADHDKANAVLERKNVLQEQNTKLRDEVRTADSRMSNLEQQYQRAQSELTDATKRISVTEASLEVSQRAKEQIEHERLSLRGELDRLQTRLHDSRENLTAATAKVAQYIERLEQVEHNSMTTSQQLMTQTANAHNQAKNKSELAIEMHRLEVKNTKLEESLKYEKERVAVLQRELNDSTQVVVTSRTLTLQEAEDSHQLCEMEGNGRSKLGLRDGCMLTPGVCPCGKIARLEKEKQELQGYMDEEKRKTQKAMELKRNSEVKLDSELQKATQLQKEVATLKAHLQASKKRLRNHISTNYMEQSEVERIKAELEAKSRVELNAKLEKVNNYLEEQVLARQYLDSMRDSNENDMRKDFKKTRKDLMDEVNKLRGSYHETATAIETKDFEVKRFRDLYESELKLRKRLAEKLEQASEKAAKAQIFMDRQSNHSTEILQNNWMASSTTSPLLLGKSAPGRGVNDLSLQISAELNRSIARHMEKSPQIDVSLPLRSTHDTNLGASSSSLNKASTDHLQVLKRKYML